MFIAVNIALTPTMMKRPYVRGLTKLVLDLAEERVNDEYLSFLRCEMRYTVRDIRTQRPLSSDAANVTTGTKRRGNGHGF